MPDVESLTHAAIKSKIYFTERVELFWGGFGLTEAMLTLLKYAMRIREYDYYHVLSGIDLPIKSKKHIKKFLEMNLYANDSVGKYKTNYVYVDESIDNDTLSWVCQYNILVKYWRDSNKVIRKISKIINRVGVFIQRTIGVNRFRYYNGKIYKGSSWWSVTHECAMYILKNKDWIKENFTYRTLRQMKWQFKP